MSFKHLSSNNNGKKWSKVSIFQKFTWRIYIIKYAFNITPTPVTQCHLKTNIGPFYDIHKIIKTAPLQLVCNVMKRPKSDVPRKSLQKAIMQRYLMTSILPVYDIHKFPKTSTWRCMCNVTLQTNTWLKKTHCMCPYF